MLGEVVRQKSDPETGWRITQRRREAGVRDSTVLDLWQIVKKKLLSFVATSEHMARVWLNLTIFQEKTEIRIFMNPLTSLNVYHRLKHCSGPTKHAWVIGQHFVTFVHEGGEKVGAESKD